jgi:hypothetical protein
MQDRIQDSGNDCFRIYIAHHGRQSSGSQRGGDFSDGAWYNQIGPVEDTPPTTPRPTAVGTAMPDDGWPPRMGRRRIEALLKTTPHPTATSRSTSSPGPPPILCLLVPPAWPRFGRPLVHLKRVTASPGQPACSAGPAVRPCGSSSVAGSCRVANRTFQFRLGPTPNTAPENVQAVPSKPRRGGKAARLKSEPCATFFQQRGFLPRRKQDNPV